MADNTCACCGAIIPEVRHICLLCERDNEVQQFHPQIDCARILKLCNEIEDLAMDIGSITMNDLISATARMIFDKAKEIGEAAAGKGVKPCQKQLTANGSEGCQMRNL